MIWQLIQTAALLLMCVGLGFAFVMYLASQYRRVALTKGARPAQLCGRFVCYVHYVRFPEICEISHTTRRLIILENASANLKNVGGS